MLDIAKRVMTCRLIEKAKEDKKFADKYILLNATTYRGKKIEDVRSF